MKTIDLATSRWTAAMRSVMAKNVRDADDHSLKAMHDQAYHFLQPVDVIFLLGGQVHSGGINRSINS